MTMPFHANAKSHDKAQPAKQRHLNDTLNAYPESE